MSIYIYIVYVLPDHVYMYANTHIQQGTEWHYLYEVKRSQPQHSRSQSFCNERINRMTASVKMIVNKRTQN